MSDTDFTPKPAGSSAGSSKKPREKVGEATGELKQRAGGAMKATAGTAQQKVSEATEAVSNVASEAADRLQQTMQERQHAGADYVQSFAGSIRQAAQAFEKDTPFAAQGMNTAADYVESVAGEIRNGSFRDVLGRATDFARQQPAAFLGLTVLAGFAAVRVLKASGDAPRQPASRDRLPAVVEPQPAVAWPAQAARSAPPAPVSGTTSPARTGNLP